MVHSMKYTVTLCSMWVPGTTSWYSTTVEYCAYCAQQKYSILFCMCCTVCAVLYVRVYTVINFILLCCTVVDIVIGTEYCTDTSTRRPLCTGTITVYKTCTLWCIPRYSSYCSRYNLRVSQLQCCGTVDPHIFIEERCSDC